VRGLAGCPGAGSSGPEWWWLRPQVVALPGGQCSGSSAWRWREEKRCQSGRVALRCFQLQAGLCGGVCGHVVGEALPPQHAWLYLPQIFKSRRHEQWCVASRELGVSQANLSSKGPRKLAGPRLSSKQGEVRRDHLGSYPLNFWKSARKDEINNLLR